ncbi:MAG: hypothetical protein AAB348_01450 [Patescibacteria group bacterium]
MTKKGSEIPPGSFRPAPPTESKIGRETKPAKAESHPDLVARYSLFKEKLEPKNETVYHPCGAYDVSPSIAFPKSRVIYVDLDKKSIEALKKAGYEAYAKSALKFNPGNIDILILLNPQIPPDIPASHVTPGGYVLSNDYHRTASTLKINPNFKLQAVIGNSKNGPIFDTKKLEDYWAEVETDDEFKDARFSWGLENYESAARLVELVTGKRENILREYKNIIKGAREQERQADARFVAENPEISIPKKSARDPIFFEHNGKQLILNPNLPRKKGTVDDIFVFQKNIEVNN